MIKEKSKKQTNVLKNDNGKINIIIFILILITIILLIGVAVAVYTQRNNSSEMVGEPNPKYVEHFGKKIEGYAPEAGGEWSLFYADKKNAYLISNGIESPDLILSENPISNLGKNLNNLYTTNSSWEKIYTSQDTSKESNIGKLYENIRAVSWLTDTNEDAMWSEYKTDYANWAIGTPTIELFVSSYNATHEEKIELKVEENSFGYQIGLRKSAENVASFGTYIGGLTSNQSFDKSIYANSGYWWLASPSQNSADGLMVSFNGGNINSGTYINNFGIRPIVSVPLSAFNNGTIKILDDYFDLSGTNAQH